MFQIKLLLSQLFLFISLFSFSQYSECLNKHQLIKSQNATLSDIREFMSSIQWEFDGAKTSELFSYFSYGLEYDLVKWTGAYSYNRSILNLYTSAGKPNIIIYQTTNSCFRSIIQSYESTGKASTRVEPDMLVTTFVDGGITTEFREYKNDYSSRQYSILIYNKAKLDAEIEQYIERDRLNKMEEERINQLKDDILTEASKALLDRRFEDALKVYERGNNQLSNNYFSNQISQCKDKIVQQNLETGDSKYQRGLFNEALTHYQKALEYDPYNKKIQEKVSSTKTKETESKINEKLTNLEKSVTNHNLEDSEKLIYELKALGDRSKKLNDLEAQHLESSKLIREREYTVHSYKKLKPYLFTNYKVELESILNEEINKTNAGNFNLAHTISFDLHGNNNSNTDILNYSNESIKNNLLTKINNLVLSPPTIGNYSLQAKEKTEASVTWKTKSVFLNQKRTSSYLIGDNYPDKRVFLEYASRHQNLPGKYKFEVKTKESQGRTYNDVYAVDYSTRGPECAIYSAVLPGLGSTVVSYGKKGWGRMITFLLCSGLSYTNYLYSQDQYKQYLSATNPEKIKEFYDNANTANQSAILLGGVALSIYVYDIIWTVAKGSKNKRAGHTIHRKLKVQKERLQYEPVKINP